MTCHRKPPLPKWFYSTEPGVCKWCNTSIEQTKTGRKSKSKWHTKCVIEYKKLFWPAVTRRAVWARDKGKCRSCGTVSPKRGGHWHMDHIKPLIESHGDISFWKMPNLQTLCKSCHTKKTSQEATDRALKKKLEKEQKK